MTTPIVSVDGQSNADGTYDVASTIGYPGNGLHLPFSAVQMMEKRANDPDDPLAWSLERGPTALSPRPGGTAGLFGIELAMCRGLVTAGYEHNVVKTSVRGSGLYNNWKVDSPYPTLSPPNLCEQWIAHLKSAENLMDGRVVGACRLQGEADAGNGAGAIAWADNQVALWNRFLEEFPGAWLVICMIHTGSGGALNSTVRLQQQLAAARIERCRIFDASHLSIIGAHYDAPSTVTLGELFVPHIQALWTPVYTKRKARSMFTFKKSIPIQAQRVLFFTAVDEADLTARLTGLAAFTVRVKKPGAGAEGPGANAPVQVDAGDMQGVYSLELSTAELDTVGYGAIVIKHSGMETRELPFCVEDATFGAVAAGTLGQSVFTTNLTQGNEYWKDALIRFLTGNLAGQVKKVGAFANTGGLITLATGLTFTQAPAASDVFEILTA